jgi:hypothetical protein
MKDLDSLTMDELHGILTVYEMRTKKENHQRKKNPSNPQRRQEKENTNQVIVRQ